MARRIVLMLVVVGLAGSLAQAQSVSFSGRHSPFALHLGGPLHTGRFGGHGFHGFFGPRHHGFNLFFPHFFPTRHHFAFFPSRILHHSVFLPGHQGLADPDGFRFFAGPRTQAFWFDNTLAAGFYPYRSPSATFDFVEEWKDRDPRGDRRESGDSGSLSDSLLLKEGMSQEQVMRVLGSPVERILLGDREVWKYSGYSLLFEGGSLKELR